ncbi:Dicer-like protein 1 [Termitomyces sp. T112]|nr:Dicer-like protein 1 [Termitomyces sp. T112]
MESPPESLLPRRYQEEVFAKAQTENIIAALDTGSGKTLIGLLLIRWISTLETSKDKVIVFLVPKVALVEQQGNFITQNTPLRVIKLHGVLDIDLTDRVRWKKRFDHHDVFVMTAQIFLNILTHAIWSIDRVSLMIFDECHHTRKNHPYNGIMREYFQTPATACRPKIFGMTASPIWNPRDPIGSLTTLEANMDSKVIAVRAHLDELHNHSPKPVEIIKEYPPPEDSYTDYPSPTLWDYLQVFERRIWDELEIPWNALEIRYFSTFSNIGPYAASLFLHVELEQHILRIHDSYLGNVQSIDHAAEMGLPSQGQLKPPPVDFWQIQQIYVDFEELLFMDAPLATNVPLPLSLTWCTPKIRILVELLLAYHRPGFQGIVFVEQRQTATCLAQILPMIPELNSLFRCGALMGQGVNSDGIGKSIPAGHKDTLESFRRGDINLLIATSVAEEGLDFPACDLVIRFDPLAHMVGYVQSRGRARNKTSTFIVMIQKGDNAHLIRYQTLKTAEPEINKIYRSRHISEDGSSEDHFYDDEVEPADLVERERYVVESTGAVLTYDNSISLLNRLCSLVPRDPFTPQHVPKYSGDFETTIILPSSIPLSPDDLTFTGPLRRSKKEAKRAAAFIAVKKLHELNVFDDFLLPVSGSKGRETEDADGRPITDVSQVPVMLDVLVHDPWTTGRSLWIHPVYIDNRLVAGLVTGTRLPPVDVVCGKSVCTRPGRRLVFEDEDEPHKRRLMLEFTRLSIWLRVTARPLSLPTSLFLVPLTAFCEIDFDAMELLVAGPRGYSDWSVINEDDFDNLIIMNTNQFGRPYLLHNIRNDLTPMSKPPTGSTEDGHGNYHEYFVQKWTRKRWTARVPTDGPLVEVHLLPRSSDGLYNLHSETTTIPTMVHTASNGLVLPRDSCQWFAMSPNIREGYEVLPALCHRISDVYRAHRARFELGLPPIIDNLLVEALTLPCADMGYNNQRLETLGDSVLKLCTTVHLYNKYPHRHEGQLSILRASSISNRFLLARAKDIGLEAYVTSERHNVHTWRYVESVDKSLNPSADRCVCRRYPRRSLQDCMEAVIGASFLTGGIPMTLHTGTSLGLSFGGPIPWAIRYSRPPVACNVSQYFIDLENCLGYTFHRPELLVEAVTHPSICSGGSPYQRLEFLGDSLLDLVVLDYLFKKFPNATSHQLSLPRAKAVCSPSLASLAVRRLNLHRILLVNRMDLMEAIESYVPLLRSTTGKEIVERGWKYDPPKALSDVFESVMGAVLVDSAYNYDKTAAVVENSMEDILSALSPSIALDPVTTLRQWIAEAGCSKLSIEKRKRIHNGMESDGVAVLVHGTIVTGPILAASQSVSKFIASERALAVLKDSGRSHSLLQLCDCQEAKFRKDAVSTDDVVKNNVAGLKEADSIKEEDISYD